MAVGSSDIPQWGVKEKSVDFFDIKGDVETLLAPLKPVFEPSEHPAMHPGRCARILLNDQVIGFLGELHPKWRQAYDLPFAPVMFELELDTVLQRQIPVFKTVAKHQSVERDIAVLVDEKITHADLMRAVWAAETSGLLKDATLFDVYRPKAVKQNDAEFSAAAEKSLAIRLTLNNSEASLNEAQIDAVMQTVVTSLVNTLGARQRA